MTTLKWLLSASLFVTGIVFLIVTVYPTLLAGIDWGKPLRSTYLNNAVLSTLSDYENRGLRMGPSASQSSHLGISRDIYYQGRKVGAVDNSGDIYCIGLTFDVFMKACERMAGANFRLKGLSSTNFADFRKEWYGVGGNQRTKVDALTQIGLGVEIVNFDEATPGDFVQFWRKSTGHSVIFLAWVVNDLDQIIGIHFWSVSSTKGVGKDHEFFEGHGGTIDPSRLYIVRAFSP